MLIKSLRATALALTLLSPFAMAVEVQESNQYLVEFPTRNASQVADAISRAGGTLMNLMPELGYATAVSGNPKFGKSLKSNRNISLVTRDFIVQ